MDIWHPGTRPPTLVLDAEVRWTGLEVLATTGGSLLVAEGIVEFAAHSVVADGAAGRRSGIQHERSRCLRAAG